jgi:YVTN family beta-propeller protein
VEKVIMKNIILIFIQIIVIHFADAQTLLVANKDEGTVSVVSLRTGKETSRISVGVGPHELAVSPSGKIAVAANYGNKQTIGNSLSVIDVIKKIKVRDISTGEYPRPHGIEFINEDEILVTSETKEALLKVNLSDGTVTELAHTGQKASHMVAYARVTGKAYVANIASGTVSAVDVQAKTLLRQIEVKKGIEGIAVSPNGEEVWVANRDDSTVTAIDVRTFQPIAMMPAHQIAYRVKFLPNGKNVIVSNGLSGNVSVYDVRAKSRIKDVSLMTGTATGVEENRPFPVGIAVSRDNKWVYVSLAGYDKVAVIATAKWSVVDTIDVGSGPDGISFSPIN